MQILSYIKEKLMKFKIQCALSALQNQKNFVLYMYQNYKGNFTFGKFKSKSVNKNDAFYNKKIEGCFFACSCCTFDSNIIYKRLHLLC